MKKTITLFASLLVGAALGVSAQTTNMQQATATAGPAESFSAASSNRFTDPLTAFQAPGDTIYSVDFAGGIPAGWTLSGPDPLWKWVPSTYAFTGCYTTGAALLNSTTKANGILVYDIDSARKVINGNTCTPPPVAATFTGSITTGSIDLSAVPFVKLRFQQRFRLCCNSSTTTITVQVSGDGGSTWTDYSASHGVALNQYPLTNPDPMEINISGSAGGKSNVKIRFTYTSESGAYFWQIDDIALVEPFANDLVLNRAWDNLFISDFLTPSADGGYTKIPYKQAILMPYTFTGAIANDGAADQTNVHLNVTIQENGTTVYNQDSPSITLPALAKDTLDITAPVFTPTNIATYTMNFAVLQSEAEQNGGNNTILKIMDVTDSVFARDNDLAGTSAIGPSNYANGVYDETGLGNLFSFKATDHAHSISFYLAASTDIGASLVAGVYLAPCCTTIPITAQIESAIYDVTDSTMKGKWVTLNMDSPNSSDYVLLPDSSYIVAVRNLNQATKKMYLGSDLLTPQPNYAPWLLLKTSATSALSWGYINVTPRIRLNTDASVGVNEVNNYGVNIDQNVPNPFNNATRINYEVNKMSNITLDVFDITGKLVYSVDKGSVAAGRHFIDLTNTFGAGAYFYTLHANEASVTKKMIVY